MIGRPSNRLRSRLAISALSLGLVVILAAAATAASAADDIKFIPEVPFPGFSGEKTVGNDFIAEYIRAIFIYFIWTVGILAVFMIVYGGVKWISAAGNPGRINDARETINNAIIGVIIALTSVLLLNVINPNLTKLGLPDIESIDKKYFEGVYVPTVCQTGVQLDVPCNQIRLVDGSKVPQEYCMGVTCTNPTHGAVCSLSKTTRQSDGKTTYQPGRGCLTEVAVVHKTSTSPEQPLKYVDGNGNQVLITTIEVNDFPQATGVCGFVDPKPVIDAGGCSADKTSRCYLEGAKAEFANNPIYLNGAFKAQNFKCSPK